MSDVKVVNCNCDHKNQDKIYGDNKRLANINEKGDKAVCTVCKAQFHINNVGKK